MKTARLCFHVGTYAHTWLYNPNIRLDCPLVIGSHIPALYANKHPLLTFATGGETVVADMLFTQGKKQCISHAEFKRKPK